MRSVPAEKKNLTSKHFYIYGVLQARVEQVCSLSVEICRLRSRVRWIPASVDDRSTVCEPSHFQVQKQLDFPI